MGVDLKPLTKRRLEAARRTAQLLQAALDELDAHQASSMSSPHVDLALRIIEKEAQELEALLGASGRS